VGLTLLGPSVVLLLLRSEERLLAILALAFAASLQVVCEVIPVNLGTLPAKSLFPVAGVLLHPIEMTNPKITTIALQATILGLQSWAQLGELAHYIHIELVDNVFDGTGEWLVTVSGRSVMQAP
jgi:hypothetical protein